MIVRRSASALLIALALAVGIAACGGSSRGKSGTGTSSSGTASSSADSGTTGTGGSGNGISMESGDAIVHAAAAAADSLKSVHVSGTITDKGLKIGLDLALMAGVGAQGSFSEDGNRVQLVTIGNTVYLNGASGFWKKFAGATAAALLAGRWLKSPGTGQLAEIREFASISYLFKQLFASYGTLTKAGTKVVNGSDAIAVYDSKQGGTLYVATSGKPYPLEVVGNGSSTVGKLDFTDFNAPVKIVAPKNAIDLGALESGSS